MCLALAVMSVRPLNSGGANQGIGHAHSMRQPNRSVIAAVPRPFCSRANSASSRAGGAVC